MERVCEELDEAKLEIEKLKEGYSSKTEQHESLKKAYNKQQGKLQEAYSRLESNEREQNVLAEEVSMLKQMYEEMQRNFAERESTVKQLSAANEKLRADLHMKSRNTDEENGSMILALEEANAKCEDQERKIKSLEEEANELRELYDSFHEKCSEAERRARSPKELRDRDDVISNLEEEVRKLEVGLKWKKEQFGHLEEAHEKLKNQYRAEKKEWESDKRMLLEEIVSLQERLESQTRISEDIGKKLERCKQALAHEEGRRKAVEVQLSHFKKQFDNVSMEREEANLLSGKDEEIERLRHLLKTKEAVSKEDKYRLGQLELENKELLASLKELREGQIHNGGKSLTRLKSKRKSVEQMRQGCSSDLQAKEAELNSKVEKLTFDLDKCRLELTSKENQLEEAEKKLEHSESLLMNLVLQNEEIYVMLLVLKSGISEARTKLQGQVMEDDIYRLKKQLEGQSKDLAAAQREVVEEHRKMKTQLERHKEILEEAIQKESASEEIIREAYDALDRTTAELTEKMCEVNEVEFELQIWKSTAERLRLDLEESQNLRKEIEASLLAQAEVEDAMRHEKSSLADMLAERDNSISCLEQKINLMEQEIIMQTSGESLVDDTFVEDIMTEAFRREFESVLVAQISTERGFEHERKELFETIEAKEHRIKDMLQTMSSMEQKFDSSSQAFSLQLAEKRAEIDLLHEAWDRIIAAVIVSELEKKMMVGELENEVNALLDSKKRAEAALEGRELEMRKLGRESVIKQEKSDALMDQLRKELADLLTERESLLSFVDETIGECCNEDMVLMQKLRNCLEVYDETVDPRKENIDSHYSGTMKRYETTPPKGRSPFREINSCI